MTKILRFNQVEKKKKNFPKALGAVIVEINKEKQLKRIYVIHTQMRKKWVTMRAISEINVFYQKVIKVWRAIQQKSETQKRITWNRGRNSDKIIYG